MPFPVQIRRHAGGLTNYLGLQGHVGLTLIEDIAPTIEVAGPSLVEFLFSLGHRRWAQRRDQAAVAAEFSGVALMNPVNSGILVVVDKVGSVSATPFSGGFIFTNPATFADAGPVSTGSRDGRIQDQFPTALRRSTAHFFTGSDPGQSFPLGNGPGMFLCSAANREVDLGVVIGPGQGFMVEGTVVATGVAAYFQWREVNLAPQETRAGG